jgi:indolepyruvate ferredoxin oxidoreductase, alpha subunit
LFTLSYTGVRGGLVLVTADDPELHSSQNEQDNRNYAKFAKMPMFEPADSQEALDYTKLAFEVSEQFDTPVFCAAQHEFRTPNQSLSWAAGGKFPDTIWSAIQPSWSCSPAMRASATMTWKSAWKNGRMGLHQPFNRIEKGKREVGVITSGVSYQYVKEVLPDADVLKLGMVYPCRNN